MARPLRIECADVVYHVTSTGNVKRGDQLSRTIRIELVDRFIDFVRGCEEVIEIPKGLFYCEQVDQRGKCKISTLKT